MLAALSRSHIAHVACCCNILLDAAACGTLDDDRNIPPTVEVPPTVEIISDQDDFARLDPDECECGRRRIFHWSYGVICEDCDLTGTDDPY